MPELIKPKLHIRTHTDPMLIQLKTFLPALTMPRRNPKYRGGSNIVDRTVYAKKVFGIELGKVLMKMLVLHG